MKRAVVVVVVMSVVAWWWLRPRQARTTASSADQRARVLADLAADRGVITWGIGERRDTSQGIEMWTTQAGPAAVEVSSGKARIATSTWGIAVDLAHVTEIVCERRFIHVPPPGTVLLDVSFRHGPDDEDGIPDELFTVAFPEAREADFRAFCARHALRTIGDGW